MTGHRSLTKSRTVVVIVAMSLLVGCAPSRFLGDDEAMLDRVSVRTDRSEVTSSALSGYVRQHPNSRWFSLLKVPLSIYCISGTDSTRRVNRFFRRIGEAPVVYDSVMAQRAAAAMTSATRNMGYLTANVDVDVRRHNHSVHVTYDVHTGEPYTVVAVHRIIDDPRLDSILQAESQTSLLHEGMRFDINVLDNERARITELLHNAGFYRFTKHHIHFDADTMLGDRGVDLTMRIPLYQATSASARGPHPQFRFRDINYVVEGDSTVLPLTPSFLHSRSSLRPGDLVSERNIEDTYNSLASLSALLGASVGVASVPGDTTHLDANVTLVPAKRHGVSVELEGTNSAGDFGAAVSLGYQNRNLFRRSTMFNLEVRGAFEAIEGLKGYADQNYIEYGVEAELHFPEFVFPFLNRSFRRSSKAQSIVSLRFNSQDRPEFHRRVLTASWRYRWTKREGRIVHRIDGVDLNYVFMPWISETFEKEYLSDDNSNRNAVLRYNYSDLFIMRWGYQVQFTNILPSAQNTEARSNSYNLRIAVETAGNFLYAMSKLFHAQYSESLGAYTLFNIAYAQYVKGDVDFSKSFRVDDRNALAIRAALGIAYPYGNSNVLPFEKRYFSGGANSVRGWAVRGLGPGSFSGSDGRVDFIRQTGDVKLDLSAEWRTHLFWKFDGAVFIDAGNVWTLREYDEQPGGQFRFDSFLRQIAVAYGLGIRLNFGYFILRLDAGMKAINPAVAQGRDHYPIVHPNFKRDFHLHFAVGLPY